MGVSLLLFLIFFAFSLFRLPWRNLAVRHPRSSRDRERESRKCRALDGDAGHPLAKAGSRQEANGGDRDRLPGEVGGAGSRRELAHRFPSSLSCSPPLSQYIWAPPPSLTALRPGLPGRGGRCHSHSVNRSDSARPSVASAPTSGRHMTCLGFASVTVFFWGVCVCLEEPVEVHLGKRRRLGTGGARGRKKIWGGRRYSRRTKSCKRCVFTQPCTCGRINMNTKRLKLQRLPPPAHLPRSNVHVPDFTLHRCYYFAGKHTHTHTHSDQQSKGAALQQAFQTTP